MFSLLGLPIELRLRIWSFCIPDEVETTVCHCFHDEEIRSRCWDRRQGQCLTIEINEDISLPTPPLLLVSRQVCLESKSSMRPHLTLVFCRYVCTIMFLYNSTVRQRALVARIRLAEEIHRPRWRPAHCSNDAVWRKALIKDQLRRAAARYYQIVEEVEVPFERQTDPFQEAEVAVEEVNMDEPSSETAVE